MLPSKITIKNLYRDSMQGDKLILDIVEKMGAKVTRDDSSVTIESDGNLESFDVDLSDAPDLLPTVAVLMATANGESRITGVVHARFKETDRVHNCAVELENVGLDVEELRDGLIIRGTPKGGFVDSHMDHRMVMAFYVLGLKIGDVKIKDASCYDVSFPNFLEVMDEITN
jgi:3-phosphoshikimate 1-carboxyvinyltransferase